MNRYLAILICILLTSPAQAQTLIEFSASWCSFCSEYAPTVASARAEGIKIETADFDKYRARAKALGVDRIPTTLALDANNREVGRIVGPATLPELRALAAKAQAGAQAVNSPPIVEQAPTEAPGGPGEAPTEAIAVRWGQFSPSGAVTGHGLLADVLSHCGAKERATAYDRSEITYCHEATHQVNAMLRNQAGGTGKVNAFYVGDNKFVQFTEPRVTLQQVSAYVTADLRNSTYQLYFVQQQSGWNANPLYVLDEWTAYVNGLQTGIESNNDSEHTSSECERAAWFCHYTDCVLRAIKDKDPNYAQLAELTTFCEWQRSRTWALVERTQWRPVARILDLCFPNRRGIIISRSPNDCYTAPITTGRIVRTAVPTSPTQPRPDVVPPDAVSQPATSQPTPVVAPQAVPQPTPQPSAVAQPTPSPPAKPEIVRVVDTDTILEAMKGTRDDIHSVLIAVSENHCSCDSSQVISVLNKQTDTLNSLTQAFNKFVTSPPTPPAPATDLQPIPAKEQHIVIVADHNASWWPRLAEEIKRTQETYHGIQTAGLPAFPIGEIPQAVVYENSVPVRIVKGETNVLDMLSRIRRGMAI